VSVGVGVSSLRRREVRGKQTNLRIDVIVQQVVKNVDIRRATQQSNEYHQGELQTAARNRESKREPISDERHNRKGCNLGANGQKLVVGLQNPEHKVASLQGSIRAFTQHELRG
jgi:hypothetical protein